MPCTTRDQCGSNEVCRDSFCEVGQAVSCSDTEPCAEGFTCIRDECEPVQEPGASCANDDQCRSGECSSGICCNRSCSGTCESCLAAETGQDDGICAPTGAGSDPGDRCGANATCDALAMCALDDGAACTMDDECGSGFCVEGVCCDAACDQGCESCLGSVSGGVDGECTFLAAGTERVSADPVFEDCPGAPACDGSGGCFAKVQGESCGGNNECASGFCTDGVCCESACSGTCQECSTGACLSVTSGIDPGTCATGCFGDGTCDGKDLLESCSAPSECASGVCAGGQCRLADGESCGTDDNICENSCIGGRCEPQSNRLGPCDSPADCLAGLECSGNSCLTPNGGSCISNDQCTNVCISGSCSARSPVNGDCDEQSDCADPTLICPGSTCLPLVALGEACEDSAQCPSPSACSSNVCLLPVGVSCSDDAECSSNNCPLGQCVQSGLGEACSFQSDCGSGLFCGPNQFGGRLRCRSTTNDVEISFSLRNRVGGTGETTVTCARADGSQTSRTFTSIGEGSSQGDFSCAEGAVLEAQCSSTSNQDINIRTPSPEIGVLELRSGSDNPREASILTFQGGRLECVIDDD